ncbi:dephospho-CoA kinase [Acidobacteriota bacterium]
MLIVALTGGIASGKSIIADVLKELGCYIHYADLVAHRFMEPDKPAWRAIVDHFGQGILNPDQTINRQKLGAIVFPNERERDYLNNLLHPLVIQEKKEVIASLRQEKTHKIFISEAALTIEAGYASFFDKIIVAYCPKDIQIARLMARDKINKENALKKIQSQLSPEEKREYADYIVDTSGNIMETIEQSEIVFRNLMMDCTLKYSNG